MRVFSSVSLLALVLAGPALAEEAPAAPPPAGDHAASAEPEEQEHAPIIVTAARLRGQVQTDSPPVIELEEKDIAAYGATSIADLVAQLAPQTGSARGRGGRPVMLLNGQRITNFREMSRFPPEAIRKVEVLPEEVATRFGYPADARVINFILKDNFASREIEAEFGVPTAGGYSTVGAEASLLRIAGPRRLNGSIEYNRTSPLTEAERGVIQQPGSVPGVPGDADPAEYRTLVARSEQIEANATMTQGLGESGMGGQFTLNGNYARSVTRSLSGLDTVLLTAPGGAAALRTLDADPLARRTQSDTASLGAGFNTRLGEWQLSTTLDASRAWVDTLIDRRRDTSALVAAAAAGALAPGGALPAIAGAGTDRARSKTYTIDTAATLIGRPLRLPAGELGVTLDAGLKLNGIDSTDTRNAGLPVSLDRRRVNGGVNLAVPLASAREGFLPALGELTIDLGGGIEHLSDFGTLTSWSAGLNWRPSEPLSLQASYRVREIAPSLGNLGNPTITQFNVPVYDFTRGQTVLATVITGGNPGLKAETQRDLKLSAGYDIKLFDRTNVLVEYYRNRSADTTESFPLLTPAIEAAFPGRVTRAADGTLLSIDRRPVTFAERRSSRVRYGINMFGRLGKPTPTPAPAPAEAAPTAPASPAPPGAAGARFDPARFAELRAKFCATPAGQAPDLTGVPEQMLERLKGPDGQIDPAKVAAMKARFCSADGAPRAVDPARFAALRTALACGQDGKAPDIAALPPEVADRLKGPDGAIDQTRLAELRTRVCAIPAPPAGAAGAPAGPRPGGGGGGGPMAMMGGRGDGQGRWNLSLYHTIELENRALVAPGGPALDLLDGDALGSGGVSRHKLELEGGVFRNGIGARLSANYLSATTVRGSGLPGSSDLRFGDLATFNLRAFVNLEQQKWLVGGGDPGLWKGMRLSLRVNNLFDARQRVTDASGTVPISYQPYLIDPVGRFLEIELRKMF